MPLRHSIVLFLAALTAAFVLLGMAWLTYAESHEDHILSDAAFDTHNDLERDWDILIAHWQETVRLFASDYEVRRVLSETLMAQRTYDEARSDLNALARERLHLWTDPADGMRMRFWDLSSSELIYDVSNNKTRDVPIGPIARDVVADGVGRVGLYLDERGGAVVAAVAVSEPLRAGEGQARRIGVLEVGMAAPDALRLFLAPSDMAVLAWDRDAFAQTVVESQSRVSLRGELVLEWQTGVAMANAHGDALIESTNTYQRTVKVQDGFAYAILRLTELPRTQSDLSRPTIVVQRPLHYHGADADTTFAGVAWLMMAYALLGASGIVGLIKLSRIYEGISARRMMAEEQHAKAERMRAAYFESILSTLPDPLYVASRDGTVVYVNPTMARLRQCEPVELLGRREYELFDLPDSVLDNKNRHASWLHPTLDVRLADDEAAEPHFRLSRVPVQVGKEELVVGIAHDDEEYRRTADTLKSTVERYRLALRGASDGIWDWDVRQNLVYFSTRWKTMLGYRENEIENSFEVFRELVHEEDVEGLFSELDQYLARSIPTFEHEFRMRRKDRSYAWILARGRAEWDSGGRPQRMAGSHTDVTVRRWAEDELRQSRRFLQTMVENLPVALYAKSFDRDGASRYVVWNRAAEEVFGCSRRIVLELGDEAFYAQDELKTVDQRDRAIVSSREPHEEAEERFLIKGSERIVHALRVPVQTRTDEPAVLLALCDDITVQVQTQAALEASQHDYRSILESLSEVVFRLDQHGRIELLNEAWTTLSGHSVESTWGQLLLDYLHPDDRAVIIAANGGKLCASGVNSRQRVRIAHRDGSFRYTELDVRCGPRGTDDADTAGKLIVLEPPKGASLAEVPNNAVDGACEVITGVIIDVHDQTIAQQALASSERRFRNLAANIPGVVFQWSHHNNRKFGYSYISPRAKQLFGLSPETILRDHTTVPIHPADRHRLIRTTMRSLNTQESFHFEGRLLLASGEVRWIDVSAHYSGTREGAALYDGIVLDVTERRQTAASLREFKQTLDVAQDAFFIFDPDTLRFTYANHGAQLQLGYTYDELLRLTPLDLKPEYNRDKFTDLLEEVRSNKSQSVQFETLHQTKTGVVLPVDILLQYVESPGEMGRYIALSRDVTERKENERAAAASHFKVERLNDELSRKNVQLEGAIAKSRRMAAQAEAANTAKSHFIATVSHDIRTPLNGILGFIPFLERASLDEQERAYLHWMKESAELLQTLISGVLDLSKIEAGQLTLEEQGFSLTEALDVVAHTLQPVAVKRHNSLHMKVAPHVPERFVGDVNRISQILFNLVGNALKFTESGSVVVDVEASPQNMAGKRQGGTGKEPRWELSIRVTDTGCGIPEAEQRRIFEPFHRLGSGNGAPEGSGLGLAICQQLCRLMQGELEVKSTVGKGSIFTLRLVLRTDSTSEAQQNEAAVSSAPANLASTHPMRVLVVDDNLVNRELIHAQLCLFGYEPALATNGREALEATEREAFDIIFMDIRMPEIDGLEATQAIRANESRKPHSTYIVALSADALTEDVLRSREAGMDAYLTKPLSEEDLARALRYAYRQRQTPQRPSPTSRTATV